MKLYFGTGDKTNPYLNLSAEWEIYENCGEKEVYLFLWQNADTVVIGANQNPYSECNRDNIICDNVKIARRKTGGGAVFHDMGNLNFSFVASKNVYDVKKQLSVIGKALEHFGVKSSFSGRNDILCEGRKFSGNAFYTSKVACLHHGTILINADFSRMKKYLTVNKDKLAKKGVPSVESRVINLSEVAMGITVKSIIPALKEAFENVYGGKANPLEIDWTSEKITSRAATWAGEDYIFGKWKEFAADIRGSFDWGCAEIGIRKNGGTIETIKIASDGLYPDKIAGIEKLLSGKSCEEITNMKSDDDVENDIINLLGSKICTM